MQNQNELEYQIHTLIKALRQYPERNIQGAKLNKLIEDIVPELDYRNAVGILTGSGALKRFVETYLTDTLSQAGFNGGDVLYDISGHEGLGNGKPNPTYWKTFVSPNSKKYLVLAKDYSLKIGTQASSIDDNSLKIENVSTAEHEKLRSDFVNSLDEKLANEIIATVDGQSEYGEWLAEIRKHGPQLSIKWTDFRRAGLLDLFRDRLEQLQLDNHKISLLINQLSNSQHITFKYSKTKTPNKEQNSSKTSEYSMAIKARNKNQLDYARSLAEAAMRSMSYDELRSIHLPLGVILDTIDKN